MTNASAIRASSALALVEAAYRLDGTEAEWLAAIVEHAQPNIDTGNGVYAFTGEASVPEFAAAPVFVQRSLSNVCLAQLGELNATAPAAIFDLVGSRPVTCGGLEQLLGNDSEIVEHFRRTMAPAGIVDGFCTFAQRGGGASITLAAPASQRVASSPRVRGLWQRMGLHFATGLMIRRRLAANTGRSPREVLVERVHTMERAGTSPRPTQADVTGAYFCALVAGRHSLIAHWERDGRRYIAAHPHRTNMRDPRALSSTEQAVFRQVARGVTTKEVGAVLGVSAKTVTGCVTQVLRKLSVRSRVELASLVIARRANLLEIPLGDEQLLVWTAELSPSTSGRLEVLTQAEREVACHVARGWNNARIAEFRGVSVSTVAKQVTSIFARLGVTNRTELACVVTREGVTLGQ